MEKTKIVTIQSAGADAKGVVRPVTIEVEITNGIGIHLVGLADAQVKETLLRTITALQALGYHIPGKKMVINIAPATIYKRGSNYDLPIAIGILVASSQIAVDEKLLNRCVFSGELTLDGKIREGEPYQGYAMAMSTFSLASGFRPYCLVTCEETAIQASPITNVLSYGFKDLGRLLEVLTRRIVGTSWLIWHKEIYKHIVDEGIKLVKAQSELPL